MSVDSIGATVLTFVACDTYKNLVLADSPVAYYRHEAGALATDSSSSGNNATTTTNVTNTTSLINCTGDAGVYDGTTSKQVIPHAASIDDLGNTGGVDPEKIFAVEFLIYLASNPASTRTIIGKFHSDEVGTPATGGWKIVVNSTGTLSYHKVNAGGGAKWRTNTALSLNTWHHVFMLVDNESSGSSTHYAFFIDGTLYDAYAANITSEGTLTASTSGSDATDNLFLGCNGDDSGTAINFIGADLDEVALYSSSPVVSSGVMMQHLRGLGKSHPTSYVNAVWDAVPIAYYRFEGSYLSIIAHDWSIYKREGTAVGNPATSAGQIDRGMSATGTTYITTANFSNNQDLALGSNIFSLETVLKVTSLAAQRMISSKGRASTGHEGWEVSLLTTGAVDVTIRFATTNSTFRSPASSVLVNNFYHIVIVAQGNATSSTGIRKIYINGVSQTITHVANPSGSQISDSSFPISMATRRNSANSAYELGFSGILDDTAIYNRELTSTEVAAHFALTGL